MGGESKQTQSTQSSQQGTTNPWEPTIDPLNKIISGISGQIPNATPNSVENGAFDTLRTNAASGNPYAGGVGDLATKLLSGGGATEQTPLINSTYQNYKDNVTPWANGSMGDPNTNPALAQMLATIRGDVSNSVNGMFAGAGRDLSGMNTQTLARGIAQGEAPVLLDAQKTGLTAANNLYSAGNTTGGILSGLNQTDLGNRGAGVDASTAALQARDSGANQQLNIEDQVRSLPINLLTKLGQSLGLLGQLGGQTTGSNQGQTTGTSTMSPAQQAWGWMNSFSNLNKSFG